MSRLLASYSDNAKEPYGTHIQRCTEVWEGLRSRFHSGLQRMFAQSKEAIDLTIYALLALHDAGKLLGPWQFRVEKGLTLPPHAPVSAAVLDEYLTRLRIDDSLRKAAVFAVAIHHIDRGTIGQNLDEPDTQAIRQGLVDFEGNLLWHPEAQNELDELAGEGRWLTEPPLLERVGLNSLRATASGLRIWARGPSVRKMHERRLQASLMHHLLRVCDVRAASLRAVGDANRYEGSLVVKTICEGGLL